jgi:hypothetical protein
MGEQDHGVHADRIAISYWDALGNETVRYFAANLPEEEIPELIDCPQSGLPAGRDKDNPPLVAKLEPYKTHLAYVKERRTPEEANQILEDALHQLRVQIHAAAQRPVPGPYPRNHELPVVGPAEAP